MNKPRKNLIMSTQVIIQVGPDGAGGNVLTWWVETLLVEGVRPGAMQG